MSAGERPGTAAGAGPRVKICGLTNERDRNAAVRAGADALGFIVDVGVETPREITSERAAELVDGVGPFVTTVLVTMAETVPETCTLQERIGADAIQVHGGLPPAEIQELGERSDADVIVAVDAEELEKADYASVADALLVDSTDDQGAGGTGETHDWERTRRLVAELDTPVILAGGLTPSNVAEAVGTVTPYGVDTATGVEHEGGQKDHDAVFAFVRRAKEGTSNEDT